MKNLEYLSVKNNKSYSKPNEDYILCDVKNNVFIVIDGVSRDLENNKYPKPSPASQVAKALAEGIFNYLIKFKGANIDIIKTLKNSIQSGNQIVREFNDKLNHSFLAGAVGIVAYIEGNILYYCYIGDCVGAYIRNDNLIILTKQQTMLIREHKSKFTKDEIRNSICNNKEHPYCYGVLNGQTSAIDLIEFGKIILKENDVIILATDGMEEIFNKLSPIELKNKSCKELIKTVEALEAKLRFTDDKSLVKLYF